MRGKSESDALALLLPHQTLLLAVSGGPDSIALMLLAAQWSGRASRDIAVATVDHGLRADSRAEAEQVGAWARARGFAHHLLTWRGPKPATRIQERARAARYALLSGCAAEIGASAIVTAHHADDQAETILFRLTRGSGVAGLAGMTAETPCGALKLLRPLLGWRKVALEELCRQAGQDYFRDPSNANETFARARLRKLQPLLAAQGLDESALLRLGQRAARADAALEFCADAARTRALAASDSAQTRFDASTLRDLPQEILQRLLATEMARLAPTAPLRLERLENAAQRLADALGAGAPLRMTIGGLLIEARGGCVTMSPEPLRRAQKMT